MDRVADGIGSARTSNRRRRHLAEAQAPDCVAFFSSLHHVLGLQLRQCQRGLVRGRQCSRVQARLARSEGDRCEGASRGGRHAADRGRSQGRRERVRQVARQGAPHGLLLPPLLAPELREARRHHRVRRERRPRRHRPEEEAAPQNHPHLDALKNSKLQGSIPLLLLLSSSSSSSLLLLLLWWWWLFFFVLCSLLLVVAPLKRTEKFRLGYLPVTAFARENLERICFFLV